MKTVYKIIIHVHKKSDQLQITMNIYLFFDTYTEDPFYRTTTKKLETKKLETKKLETKKFESVQEINSG